LSFGQNNALSTTEHHGKISDKTGDPVSQPDGLIAVWDEREPESQQNPRPCIVSRGAHQSRRAKASREQSPFLQNARKYGKRGNAHRNANKEKKHGASNALRPKPCAQRWRQSCGKNARNQDAHAARQCGSFLLAAEMLNIELASYEENKQHQTDVAQHLKPIETALREKSGEHLRCGTSKKRRSKKNASNHLADHPGLTKLLSDPPAHKRREQDYGHLNQKLCHPDAPRCKPV
jgi:hypothetical protein